MKKTAKNQKLKAVPDGFHTVTPYLIVDNADELIEFIKNAFQGELTFMHRTDDNKVSHATVKIGNSLVMISDTMSDMEPELAMLYLYVDNVDALYESAMAANAESIQEPKDQFYGDRACAVKDRWGNKWWIATHIENVDEQELHRRAEEARQKEAHAAH
jgi:PhnB protein